MDKKTMGIAEYLDSLTVYGKDAQKPIIPPIVIRTKSVVQAEFEVWAENCIFNMEQLPSGQYKNMATFHLWRGYLKGITDSGVVVDMEK